MPTYDYECRGCGKSFEIFQRMSEAPKTSCHDCGEETLERLIGAGAGFLFKGSGFYITDYRSSDYKSRAKADSGSSSSGSSKECGGSGKGCEGGSCAKAKAGGTT